MPKNLWEGIKEFYVELWEGIREWFFEMLEGIKKFYVELWEGIRDWLFERIAIPALALVILAALLLAANTAHNAREQHRQNLAELRHEAAYLAWENEQIARHNRQLREQHAEELERLIKSAGEQDTYTVIPAATITKYAPHDCPPSCGLCFAGDREVTATGDKPVPGQTAAVDPAYIPLGSRIYVEGLGWYEANDTGGDVRGWHVDIVAANHVEAEQWGVQDRLIIIEEVQP